ncbi:xanthine dehydrogenase family protein molybdopterin-binding subunit [Aestuariispira ectoiniformans]|uniref:xanthine dehydrogenase family protein molybdopterin-binding subunit n=1 Tax=Aestuariispira ectoiniformans TaxID=2775080 RepID=UPI00223B1820|nr:molybdopterin cofactor-binding domain-containing protein [Aestuariispira ectoiniformans]
MQLSRRTLLKSAGAAITVNCINLPKVFAEDLPALAPPPGWSGRPGKARYRIDGLAKVTGQKIFARDYHASDMNGWPAQEQPVMILRALHADRPFKGLDLSMLPDAARPSEIITGDMLGRGLPATSRYGCSLTGKLDPTQDNPITLPSSICYDLLVVPGDVPAYLGQPLAMLLFRDRKSFRAAKKALQFNADVQVYNPPTSPLPDVVFPPETNYVRYTHGNEEKFSYAQNGGDADYATRADKYANLINEEIKQSDWLTFTADYSMQAMDPMFMEPESGLAWYDASTKTMHLVVGTQSPDDDIKETKTLFESQEAPVEVETVNLYSCYPGGGFGGRDKSVFTMNLAIAAAYANGQPVRIAYDRFEQFQAGLKRHPAKLQESVSVDKNGKIQAVVTDMEYDAGGRKNLSPYVAQLSSLCAGGGYSIPRSSIQANAKHSTNISGGSQRGFGGPQAFFALESSLDEAAEALNMDAIDLRLKNILYKGDHTVVGGPVNELLRLEEICHIAKKHRLWQERYKEQKRHSENGQLYGVGYALSMQAYGTSGDGMLGAVKLLPDGRIDVISNAVDMGNGSATTLAVVTARYLGNNAREVQMGDPEVFAALDLASGGTTQWDNPRWTKKFSGSSSACLTAFHQVHAIEQASKVLFDTAILPAARRILGPRADRFHGRSIRWLENGNLKIGNLPELPMSVLAHEIFKSGGYTQAMIHAYFQEHWVRAEYQVDMRPYEWEIDALALFPANSDQAELINRQNGHYPSAESGRYSRTTFAPCGNLIAVTVDPQSGKATVVDSVSILNAGRIITEGIVSGQSQGGVAQSVGYTLLEDMPPGLAGPANGQWNLNRYHVPLARDVALQNQELITLPPLHGEWAAKGIAEAVMCSVPPAIANALAMATGTRFRDLPITQTKIQEALAKS